MSRIRSASVLAAAAALASLVGAATPAFAHDGGRRDVGHVYQATNAAGGNAVQVFDRAADGRLTAGPLVATGGLGTGASLASQGGIVRDGRTLLVVNAGDDTVSSFAITERGLELRDVEPSGGDQPVSVTVHDDTVYVLNAGSDTISGLRLGDKGRLRPINNSTRPLSGTGTGAAQIQFSTDGDALVVTEKATNRILTYPVGRNGRAGAPTVNQSAGTVPYGFDIDRRDTVIVSEAATGSTSSYRLRDGALSTVSAAVPLNQGAPCWLVLSVDGRFAYTTNAASGSISSYRVGRDGSLTLLASVAGTPGAGPTDVARSADGRNLYVRVRTGEVVSFAIAADGSLTNLGTVGGATAVGPSGLAAL